jgi:hypothetical protein
MPTPTLSLDFAKVGIGILVIDFHEPGQLSKSSKKISLQFNTSLDSLPPFISQL